MRTQEILSDMAREEQDDALPLAVEIMDFYFPVYEFIKDAFAFAFIIVLGVLIYLCV